MKQLLVLAAFCLLAFGADASGKWTGTLVPSDGDGSGRPAHLILKQEGDKLTGTAGPRAEEQHPIQNGKVNGNVLTFEVAQAENVMRFHLKLEGNEITGEITRMREGQTQTAKLSVKREE